MVVRNKLYKIFDRYRSFLKYKKNSNPNKLTSQSNKTKNKILDFYLDKGRWPNRRSKNSFERALGQRFENYLSKESGCYDSSLRRLAMATGRTTNKKRKHNKKEFKRQILEFIDQYGRTPMAYDSQIIEGEGNLRHKLDYYTLKNNDMSFLSEVYKKDRCHKTGIPGKYRALINKALESDKPLIRLV